MIAPLGRNTPPGFDGERVAEPELSAEILRLLVPGATAEIRVEPLLDPIKPTWVRRQDLVENARREVVSRAQCSDHR